MTKLDMLKDPLLPVDELTLQALRDRVAALEAENEALRQQLAAQGTAGAVLPVSEPLPEKQQRFAMEPRATQTLIDTLTDVVMLVTVEGIVVDCNRTAAGRYGLRREELVGRVVWDLMSADVAERRRAIGLEVQRLRGPIEFIDKRDGLTFVTTVAPVLEDSGVVSLFAISSRDVTEQDTLLARLRQDHALLSAVIEGTEDAIYAKDRDARLILVNTACARILGGEAKELLGKTNHQLVPLKIADDITAYDREVMAAGVSVTNEETLFVDGEARVFLSTKAPLRSEQGEVIGILGVARDITMRSRAEEALRQSEQKFRTLSESSPMGAFWTDKHGRVLYTNKRWQEITGMGFEESLGDGWLRALHPDDVARIRSGWSSRVRKAKGWQGEFRFSRPDGTVRTVWTCTAPILSKTGEVVGHIGANEDITERRAMALEVQKAQRLESLGVLAGGIAHDFNNLLTALWGNLQLIADDVGPNTDVADLIADSQTACRHATRLTKQLLTFARGGAPVRKACHLGTVIRDSAKLAVRGDRVHCTLALDEALWVVDIDEAQMGQVFHNLTINAAQSMPEGGSVDIAAVNVVVDEAEPGLQPGRYVRVSVKDEGVGIPTEELPHIFDPYYTTKMSGSGLGLATSFSIVRKHGGTLRVDSNPGAGSVFVVTLPAAATNAVMEPSPPLVSTVGRGRVLVMDDEAAVRRVASRALTRLGYSVTLASAGEEAVAAYRDALSSDAPYLAVILDLTVVGGMNGLETLTALRALDPQVRAIVSSGYSSDPVLGDFDAYGFVGVLEKPYELETLSTVLATL